MGELHPQSIACDCGQVRGAISDTKPLYGHHFICMCDDCQAYAYFLGRPHDFLDKNGGTDIIPTFAGNFKITAGQNKLKCMRLSDKGMYRWYACCCNSPIANCMDPKVGYIGAFAKTLPVDRRDDVLGPVKAKVMAKFARPPVPRDAHKTTPLGFMLFVMKEMTVMLLKGLRKPNPFFDQKNQPLVPPKVLTKAELERLKQNLRNYGATNERDNQVLL